MLVEQVLPLEILFGYAEIKNGLGQLHLPGGANEEHIIRNGRNVIDFTTARVNLKELVEMLRKLRFASNKHRRFDPFYEISGIIAVGDALSGSPNELLPYADFYVVTQETTTPPQNRQPKDNTYKGVRYMANSGIRIHSLHTDALIFKDVRDANPEQTQHFRRVLEHGALVAADKYSLADLLRHINIENRAPFRVTWGVEGRHMADPFHKPEEPTATKDLSIRKIPLTVRVASS